MSTMSLYDSTSPVFVKLLTSLSGWLDKAEAFAKAKNIDVEVLMNARLAPDMFPLSGQISIATAFAKNTMCRLAGETPPDFPAREEGLANLRARIAKTLDIVQSVRPQALEGAAERPCTFNVAPNTPMTLPGTDYLCKFALPNFYFHITMAYAILRHNGLDLGKQDFMKDLMSQ